MRRSTSFGNISVSRATHKRVPYTPTPGCQSSPLWDQARGLDADSEPTSEVARSQHQLSKTFVRTLKRSVSSTYLPQSGSVPAVAASVVTKKKTNVYHHHSFNKNVSLNKSMSNVSVNAPAPSPKRQLFAAKTNGHLHDTDSSSSDASPAEVRANTVVPKGIVARRMKAFCSDPLNNRTQNADDSTKKQRNKSELEKSKSDWDLRKLHDSSGSTRSPSSAKNADDIRKSSASNVNRNEPACAPRAGLDQTNAGNDTSNGTSESLDLNSLPLTKELCDKVCDELQNVSSFTVQLMQRLQTDPSTKTSEKSYMSTTLAHGVWQAQQILQRISAAPGTATPMQPDPPDSATAMLLLQQYSDRLLTLFEKKMTAEK